MKTSVPIVLLADQWVNRCVCFPVKYHPFEQGRISGGIRFWVGAVMQICLHFSQKTPKIKIKWLLITDRTVRCLSWKYLNFKGSKKKYTEAGFLQGHPYWTPKKGSKARLAKFWDAWIWRNFLWQKMLFLAIFTHFFCPKFHQNSVVIQKW